MITNLQIIFILCIIQIILCLIRFVLLGIQCKFDKKQNTVEDIFEYDINQEFAPILTRK